MTKCGYCKDKITLAPIGFSGIKEKFCQTCWHKLYTVLSAQKLVIEEPELWDWTLKINGTERTT